MPSVYPGAFDAFTNPLPTDKRTNHAAQHGNVNDAVEAIQSVLGLLPQGGSGTVSARIGVVEGGVLSRVSGPGSSTDNALVRFDGTNGKTVQNSGITVDDSGRITSDLTFSAALKYLYFAPGGAHLTQASGSLYTSSPVIIDNRVRVSPGSAHGLELGASGPRVMSGTGSPEGVVSAPVGSQWTDTAATAGAIRWVKASGAGSTGWVVDYGDTGSRLLSAGLLNGWAAGTDGLRVRRVGRMVTLTLALNGSAATASTIYSLPAGFRAYTRESAVAHDGGAPATPHYVESRDTGDVFCASRLSIVRATLTYTTNDAWPSTLPGT